MAVAKSQSIILTQYNTMTSYTRSKDKHQGQEINAILHGVLHIVLAIGPRHYFNKGHMTVYYISHTHAHLESERETESNRQTVLNGHNLLLMQTQPALRGSVSCHGNKRVSRVMCQRQTDVDTSQVN